MNATLQLVMKYLFEHDYKEALLSLERESGFSRTEYARQIKFLHSIILRGDFEETVRFLANFESKWQPDHYKTILLCIHKTRLLELIEQPEEEALRNLLEKELPFCCGEEEYEMMFDWLTYKSVTNIPGMAKWTPVKGRQSCFETILPYLSILGDIVKHSRDVEGSLEQIVETHLSKMNQGMLNRSGQHIFKKAKNHQEVVQPEIIQCKKEGQVAQEKEGYLIKSNPSSIPSVPPNPSRVSQSPGSPSNLVANLSTLANNAPLASNISNIHVDASSPSNAHSASALLSRSQVSSVSRGQPLADNFMRQSKQMGNRSKLSDRSRIKPSVLLSNKKEEVSIEQVRRNIDYLEQTSSGLYPQLEERDNFTFSHQTEEEEGAPVYKETRLATIRDGKAIRTCQFSRSGQYFAVGTNSSLLRIFSSQQIFAKKQKEPQNIYCVEGIHTKSIFCLDWSRSQKTLITCSNDQSIRLTEFENQFTKHKTTVIGQHDLCVRMAKFNEQQNKVYSCGDDAILKVWDLGSIRKCTQLKGHTAAVAGFYLSRDSPCLYSVGKDAVKKWDIRSGECVKSSRPCESQLTSVVQEKSRVACSHKDGQVSFLSLDLELIHSVKTHEDEIRSIEANEGRFLTASFDGNIALFQQKWAHCASYFRHNEQQQDKVVFATFLRDSQRQVFASTSTLGRCSIFNYE